MYGAVHGIAVMGLIHRAMADFLPNFEGHNHVHGEHYFKLLRPYTTPRGSDGVCLTINAKFVDIVSRKRGVLVYVDIVTVEANFGTVTCENEWAGFAMNVPAAGSNASQFPRGARSTLYSTPTPPPDKVLTHKTSHEQAALYRAASGDLNPLHIDPSTGEVVGFAAPILTGTCTLGIGVRHMIEGFAGEDASRFSSVKVRLSKPVYAGVWVMRLEPRYEMTVGAKGLGAYYSEWLLVSLGVGLGRL